MLAGLDIGYGAVKINSEGDGQLTFPSVTGSPDLPRFGLGTNNAIVISNGVGRTVVGEAAITQSRFIDRQEDRRWIYSDQYKSLFYASLTEISRASSESITLISGLPLAYFDDKTEVQDLLSGTHRVTREYPEVTRTHTYEVKAYVIPQPFGSLCSMAFDGNGDPVDPAWLTGTVGILDIGSHTTNVLTTSRGQEVSYGTTSIPTGCWDIVRAISARVSDLFPQLERRDHDLVKDIQLGQVPYHGEAYDISQTILEVSEPMSREIISAATQHWDGGAALDKILITGGGAHLIGEFVVNHFDQHRQVFMPRDPVFANVQGYLRYGLYLQKQGEI